MPLQPGAPARNMAVDEAILRAYAQGLCPPTLRFYTWDPPAVSCGRFQAIEREIDLEACRAAGVAVVRRPTGGRAVLHEGDLTYAVIAGEEDGLPPGVLPAYLHLSKGLQRGLLRLGVSAGLHTPRGKAPDRNPACFASPSWYELTVAGRKVAGSAQRREGAAILQHGSIVISLAADKFVSLLRFSRPGSETAKHLTLAAAGLSEFVPGLAPPALAAALAEGFAEALRVEIHAGSLSPAEEGLAAELEPKYLVLG